jgi:glycerol kinase
MTKPRYVLALDQGTTSSRSIVFGRGGEVIAVAQKEFTQFYPQPGWVEHNPLEIWASQNATAVEALSKANLTTDNIAAVGVTNQRETTLVWDRETGKPVYNAIVWQDRRTADYCTQLKRDGAEAARRSAGSSKTSAVPAPAPKPASSPSAPSIRGCCGNSPGAAST